MAMLLQQGQRIAVEAQVEKGVLGAAAAQHLGPEGLGETQPRASPG